MKTESESGVQNIQAVQNWTADATGVCKSVQNIVQEADKSNLVVVFNTPGKNRLITKLHADIGFNGSISSLRTIIKKIGFAWKRTENNIKFLIEHTDIRLKRIEYLKKISKYREGGRPIVYTNKSYRARHTYETEDVD